MKVKITWILLTLILFPNVFFGMDGSFLNNPAANKISIRSKTFGKIRDWIFTDGLGREVSFRGWNFSNRSKGGNHCPFNSLIEAQTEINKYSVYTGSNMMRWLFIWSGIHTAPGVIDYKHLDEQISYMKLAIKTGTHILVDFHQDLFNIGSDGSFSDNDGPPSWLLKKLTLPNGGCGSPCLFWSQNYITNKKIKAAFNRFWNNASYQDADGKHTFQGEYLFMFSETMKYLKSKLTPYEWDFIVGVDPMNEPIPGDLQNDEKYKDWTNNKLFPFYIKVRNTLNTLGMSDKLVFSEPSTFWNMNVPLVYLLIKPSGPLGLRYLPGPGFVFNAHAYDEVREAYGIVRVENGAYMPEFNLFRTEARFMHAPPFMSEFGAWDAEAKPDIRKKVTDPQRRLKANFQAMEMSFPKQVASVSINFGKFYGIDFGQGIGKIFGTDVSSIDLTTKRVPRFYTPLISSTQWDWGMLGHRDEMVGYAFCRNKAHCEGYGQFVYARSYPRRIQGDLMSFYYNDATKDYFSSEDMNWVGLQYEKKNDLFIKNKFALLIWRAKPASGPSEIYLPRHFDLSKSVLLYDNRVINLSSFSDNDVAIMKDANQGGKRLFIGSPSLVSGYHFALIVEKRPEDNYNSGEFSKIANFIFKKIKSEQSPLYLHGVIRSDLPSFTY